MHKDTHAHLHGKGLIPGKLQQNNKLQRCHQENVLLLVCKHSHGLALPKRKVPRELSAVVPRVVALLKYSTRPPGQIGHRVSKAAAQHSQHTLAHVSCAMQRRMHGPRCTHARAHTHAHTHARAHTRTHTHTHMHTHTHRAAYESWTGMVHGCCVCENGQAPCVNTLTLKSNAGLSSRCCASQSDG